MKTKEMLLSAEQWRIDFKVDDIVQFVFSRLPLERLFDGSYSAPQKL